MTAEIHLVTDYSAPHLMIVADKAAKKARASRWFLTPEPLYIANKANVSNRARFRRGSKEWQRIQAFEMSIAIAAERALAAHHVAGGERWRRDVAYWCKVDLIFGKRTSTRRATSKRRGGPVVQTSERRCESFGVDSIKSVLDALQPVLLDRDEQICDTRISKGYYPPEAAPEGDTVRIAMYPSTWGIDP